MLQLTRWKATGGPVFKRPRSALAPACTVHYYSAVYTRHSFVWPTFSQKLVDVIEGLEAAWGFFEGVPNYLVIDNFPSAVAGVDPLHPRLTRGFLEYSQHRGFIADPARVRHPRDKPRVERGVPYVRERFFKGGEFTGLSDMRSAARRSCLAVAGQRVHGTTRRQPLAVFGDEERHALGEWDAEPYEMTGWRTAKVHPDHHIACQYALYSVPSAACPPGQKVEVRLGSKLVRIYHRGRLIGDGSVCLRSTSLESPYDYWGRYTQRKRNPTAPVVADPSRKRSQEPGSVVAPVALMGQFQRPTRPVMHRHLYSSVRPTTSQ